MQTTGNYGLKKPENTDVVNIEDLNYNADTIDGLLKNNGDALNAHLNDYTLQVPYAGTTAGSANTYTIGTPVVSSLTTGMAVSMKIHADSTGVSTLNWCGLGAKSIKKANGTNVTNLKANGIYTLRYDGTNFILQGEGASGNATASDLLSGKTATTDAGEITGTMPNRGTVTITPSTSNQTITAGYHNGSGYVVGDADLVSANIKAGINIFGVAGNSNVVDTSAGDATAAQILSGKKAFVDGSLVSGTISSKSAATYTPGTSNQTIAAGQYLSGAQTISGDAKLVSTNIKSGVSIFGVSGNSIEETTKVLIAGDYFSGTTWGHTYSGPGASDVNSASVLLGIGGTTTTPPYTRFNTYMWSDESGGLVDHRYYTAAIGLTNFTYLKAGIIPKYNYQGANNVKGYVVVSSNQTGTYDVYTIRAEFVSSSNDPYQYALLDVSALSGLYYIRLHLLTNLSETTGTLQIQGLVLY